MIKENQRVLNGINILTDGLCIFLMLLIAFWIRFHVLPGGIISIPFLQYAFVSVFITCIHIMTYAAFGLYRSFRTIPLIKELPRLWLATLLDLSFLLSILFIQKDMNYSRLTLAIFFVLAICTLSCKRVLMRKLLRKLRESGYNQKNVVVIGIGPTAEKYINAIRRESDLGFHAIGYIAHNKVKRGDGLKYLGSFRELELILDQYRPDEVISAIEMEDYPHTPEIIQACEKVGIKLSIIPFYAKYMPSNPEFDEVGGIPLLNIRRIPLDNWANAAIKRLMDIIGSLLLIILTSPIMLVCAIGVKISSPGPIFFRQERVGRYKQLFYMYKFRSMRVNDSSNVAWSSNQDSRKTKFGAFLRKFSLDEFPQFFNVLVGDMSLVGPRPEIPFYVEQFKDEVPLYMVKHQVRPGITGWAQVNGFRGDTSIKGRIQHDVYYIEHWNLLFDIKILFMTVFGGKFMNSESLHS